MMDYWISFVVSQDPNDGKGNQRPNWPQFTSSNKVSTLEHLREFSSLTPVWNVRSKVLMQLNGTNSVVVPDDYREKQIQFFNDNALLFHH